MEQFRAWSRQLSAYGIIARYALGTAIVGIVTVAQLIATPLSGGHVFILYYPAVTLSALLLDRGTGFYAAILSAFLGPEGPSVQRFTVASWTQCQPRAGWRLGHGSRSNVRGRHRCGVLIQGRIVDRQRRLSWTQCDPPG